MGEANKPEATISNGQTAPIAEQVQSTSPSAEEIASGNFVGGSVALSGLVVGGDLHITTVIDNSRNYELIERLRGRLARLLPAERSLHTLTGLREPTASVTSVALPGFSFRLTLPKDQSSKTEDDPHFSRLHQIEAQLLSESEPSKQTSLLVDLRQLADDINVRISALHSTFVSLLYPALSAKEVTEATVSRIAHRDLRHEAQVHLQVISGLVNEINLELLRQPNLDVLGDAVTGAVGTITDIEKRRKIIEDLVLADAKRRTITISFVTLYLILVLSGAILALVLVGSNFRSDDQPLELQTIGIFWIPWPVIVWSLVGSLAAMIHRFNRNPIQEFGDAVKWLITRPVQGVILGSAMYLVLISGLLLLTGRSEAAQPASLQTNAVILVLCFLVGFSDRFADGVFDALVRGYGQFAAPNGQTSGSGDARDYASQVAGDMSTVADGAHGQQKHVSRHVG